MRLNSISDECINHQKFQSFSLSNSIIYKTVDSVGKDTFVSVNIQTCSYFQLCSLKILMASFRFFLNKIPDISSNVNNSKCEMIVMYYKTLQVLLKFVFISRVKFKSNMSIFCYSRHLWKIKLDVDERYTFSI